MINSLKWTYEAIGEKHFLFHPKGHGVIVKNKDGIPVNTMITEYLGELYHPFRWNEKQDGIMATQSLLKLKIGLPDFYNILLEQPGGYEKTDGYGVSFVDASRRANEGSTLSHSCDPTCQTKIVSQDGKISIAMVSIRDIQPGEELSWDYSSVTQSEKEWREAVCFCGTSKCRGSYLYFSSQSVLQKIYKENCGPTFRFSLIAQSCDTIFGLHPSFVHKLRERLEEHGFKTNVFGNLAKGGNSWLSRWAYFQLGYIEFERGALAYGLLEHDLDLLKDELKSNPNMDKPSLSEKYVSVDSDARCIMEERVQSLVSTISNIVHVNHLISNKPQPPPLDMLSLSDCFGRYFLNSDSQLTRFIGKLFKDVDYYEERRDDLTSNSLRNLGSDLLNFKSNLENKRNTAKGECLFDLLMKLRAIFDSYVIYEFEKKVQKKVKKKKKGKKKKQQPKEMVMKEEIDEYLEEEEKEEEDEEEEVQEPTEPRLKSYNHILGHLNLFLISDLILFHAYSFYKYRLIPQPYLVKGDPIPIFAKELGVDLEELKKKLSSNGENDNNTTNSNEEEEENEISSSLLAETDCLVEEQNSMDDERIVPDVKMNGMMEEEENENENKKRSFSEMMNGFYSSSNDNQDIQLNNQQDQKEEEMNHHSINHEENLLGFESNEHQKIENSSNLDDEKEIEKNKEKKRKKLSLFEEYKLQSPPSSSSCENTNSDDQDSPLSSSTLSPPTPTLHSLSKKPTTTTITPSTPSSPSTSNTMRNENSSRVLPSSPLLCPDLLLPTKTSQITTKEQNEMVGNEIMVGSIKDEGEINSEVDSTLLLKENKKQGSLLSSSSSSSYLCPDSSSTTIPPPPQNIHQSEFPLTNPIVHWVCKKYPFHFSLLQLMSCFQNGYGELKDELWGSVILPTFSQAINTSNHHHHNSSSSSSIDPSDNNNNQKKKKKSKISSSSSPYGYEERKELYKHLSIPKSRFHCLPPSFLDCFEKGSTDGSYVDLTIDQSKMELEIRKMKSSFETINQPSDQQYHSKEEEEEEEEVVIENDDMDDEKLEEEEEDEEIKILKSSSILPSYSHLSSLIFGSPMLDLALGQDSSILGFLK